jgi:hypothetical protein
MQAGGDILWFVDEDDDDAGTTPPLAANASRGVSLSITLVSVINLV